MSQPLFLRAALQEKIWGGARLEEFGFNLPSRKVGEAWSISAHQNGLSVIENGEFKGLSLDVLYKKRPDLFGHPKDPVFPLLTKILDANEWLSVQVHPDDDYGLRVEGELGKTECWYIIDASPGAEIIYGHKAKSREELKAMMDAGRWDDLLERIPVKKGDFFFVPSGTVHAIGPGILILETQQSSDTTYRLYDFDRPDDSGNLRELHLDKALDVITVPALENSLQSNISTYPDGQITSLLESEFFNIEKWVIKGDMSFVQKSPYSLVTVLEGVGKLQVSGTSYPLAKGQSFILANDIKSWQISGELTLLASSISSK
ncbi:mannose-6-phosphate isomerase, class I [Streptococcaceae bacterium ESL0729]|nr:mannose-6-phosphate isomerase, class I [Streptococcaceae bacterium ESL0729]